MNFRDLFRKYIFLCLEFLLPQVPFPSFIDMFKLVFLPSALVSASSMEVATDHWGRFPVEFSVDNAPMNGYAALNLVDNRFSFTFHGSENRRNVRDRLRPATGVSIAGNRLRISFQNLSRSYTTVEVVERTELPNVNQRLLIGASPHSTLSQHVTGFLMAPITPTEGRIVFSPEHPENYALDNQLFYAHLANNPEWAAIYGHHDLWGVNAAIRFVNESDAASPVDESASPFIPCLIGSLNWNEPYPEPFRVPSRVIRDFVRIAQSRGLEVLRMQEAPYSLFVNGITDALMQSLPTMQYIVQTEDGQQVSVINLDPHQYIIPTDNPNQYRVRLGQARVSSYCSFNEDLRRRMVLHFDTQNQRVGFGEPLIEF